ncbi:MAG: dipeptidase [Pseudomonadota bacterium]
MGVRRIYFSSVLAALVLQGCELLPEAVAADPAEPETSPAIVDEAEEPSLHQQLLVLDSHLDTPIHFARQDYSLIGDQSFSETGTQVDLGRMEAGGLDGGFFVIFTPQGPLTDTGYQLARDAAMERAFQIREATARYNQNFALAFDASDAAAIAGEGKRIVYQSIENSYPLGLDVSLLQTFYRFGVRMVGPVHFLNNQFADSATDLTARNWGGLSPLGEDLVREANRLGMVLDGSHAHDETVRDMMALSTTPIILSHTGVKAIFDHPRNIDDDLLRALAENGGVIQINAYGGYLEALIDRPERTAALEALRSSIDGDPADLEGEALATYQAELEDINEAFPPPRSTFEKFIEHLLHALDVVGPDHVGIGADWDGGGGVRGMEDIASLPKVTDVLLDAGYSAEDIEKIWSGNMLRLLKAAEEAATVEVRSLPTVN